MTNFLGKNLREIARPLGIPGGNPDTPNSAHIITFQSPAISKSFRSLMLQCLFSITAMLKIWLTQQMGYKNTLFGPKLQAFSTRFYKSNMADIRQGAPALFAWGVIKTSSKDPFHSM